MTAGISGSRFTGGSTKNTFRVAVAFALAAIACFVTRPVPAAETLTIGGTGGALGTMKRLSAAFEKSHPGITVVVIPNLGSGGGIRAVAKGAIDIGLSVRAMTADERKLGLGATEYAKTPLVFAVRAGNPLPGLNQDEFLGILQGGRSAWLHGQRMRPILRPANDAETLLVKKHFPAIGAAIERTLSSRVDATVALTSQEAADLIAKIPGAVGFSPLSLIRSEDRPLKVLPFNGVAPDAANVADGSYPLVLDLYLVTRRDPPDRVRQFIGFVRSQPGRRILEESGNFAIGKRQ